MKRAFPQIMCLEKFHREKEKVREKGFVIA
jgi:hypothetical protein